MKNRKTITLRLLQCNFACGAAKEQFVKDWGSKGKPKVYEVVKRCWRLKRADWAVWVMCHALRDKRWREWDAVRWASRRKDKSAVRRIDYKYARMIGKETP